MSLVHHQPFFDRFHFFIFLYFSNKSTCPTNKRTRSQWPAYKLYNTIYAVFFLFFILFFLFLNVLSNLYFEKNISVYFYCIKVPHIRFEPLTPSLSISPSNTSIEKISILRKFQSFFFMKKKSFPFLGFSIKFCSFVISESSNIYFHYIRDQLPRIFFEI